MNINIFNGYQSTVPAVIKFQQMVDIIRGDKQLAELTKRYRITHQREYKEPVLLLLRDLRLPGWQGEEGYHRGDGRRIF